MKITKPCLQCGNDFFGARRTKTCSRECRIALICRAFDATRTAPKAADAAPLPRKRQPPPHRATIDSTGLMHAIFERASRVSVPPRIERAS